MLMHNAIAVIYTKDVKRSYLVPSKETKSDESAVAPIPEGRGGRGWTRSQQSFYCFSLWKKAVCTMNAS